MLAPSALGGAYGSICYFAFPVDASVRKSARSAPEMDPFSLLRADYMSRASPANRADLILSRPMVA